MTVREHTGEILAETFGAAWRSLSTIDRQRMERASSRLTDARIHLDAEASESAAVEFDAALRLYNDLVRELKL